MFGAAQTVHAAQTRLVVPWQAVVSYCAAEQVVHAAHAERKTIGICGEMAGNPASAVLLMAMGYDMLSMNSPNVLLVKAMVRSFALGRAKALLDRVMTMDNPHLIKNAVEQELRDAGLGRLLRTGGKD